MLLLISFLDIIDVVVYILFSHFCLERECITTFQKRLCITKNKK